MSFIGIPANKNSAWYKFKISLSDVIYTLRFRYNTRMQRWMLDVADAADNDVLNGLPVLIKRNLLGQFVIEGLPIGTMFISDDTNKDEQPSRNSFGLDKTFFYEDPLT